MQHTEIEQRQAVCQQPALYRTHGAEQRSATNGQQRNQAILGKLT